MVKVEHLFAVGALIGTIVTIWNLISARITAQEKRLTLMEAEIRFLRQQVESNISRLNDHEKQQQTLFALVQKVNSITEDLTEVKADLKQLLLNGGKGNEQN
ncbi:hypothetical protein NHG32_06830 [Aerococcaceae bacterium NML191219]|nr:hypothetical protein [Aerococcaceae bacterium NML191219]